METKSKQRTIRISENAEQSIEKLFVYGIFLSEINRKLYSMENASYDTVKGFITVGSRIVKAISTDTLNACLTGLLVDIPTKKLPALDALESGYDRIKVKTTSGFEAYMYASPGSGKNYSTYSYKIYES